VNSPEKGDKKIHHPNSLKFFPELGNVENSRAEDSKYDQYFSKALRYPDDIKNAQRKGG